MTNAKLHVQKLPADVRKYLNEERMLGDEIIDFMKLGYCEIRGERWLVFPIKNKDGVQHKLKGLPGNPVKAKNWPQGCAAQLYAAGVMRKEGVKEVVICEGEPDCLLLLQAGFAAVTSTAGAMTFKEEWVDLLPKQSSVILCFDADEAGDKGREKVRAMLIEKRKDCTIFDVRFDEYGTEGYDVTDYWRRCKDAGEDAAKGFRSLVKEYVPADHQEREIADIGEPRENVKIEDWRPFVGERFPTLAMTAEVVCSVVCQLIIEDVHNPFALVLIDKAGSGKTIALNFIKDIDGLTYSSSDFSPASFVSNIAARSAKQLEQIDLLPRVRWKTLVVKDLAPIMADNDDTLRKRLGMLTDILDGEGYRTDSGVYGQRGYKGDYLFMLVAASTPFPGRVWKLMVGLGHRLFFLGIGSPMKTVDELIGQVRGVSFKVKEKECQDMTGNLLRTVWKRTGRKVVWNQAEDDMAVITIIAQMADLLARFRGDIFVHEERWTKGEMLTTTEPRIEDASRANQCLYNLARGHAVLCGRDYITKEDVWTVVRVAFDTAPNPRPKVLRELLHRNGKVTTGQMQTALGASLSTARKELHKMVSLGICDGDFEKESDAFGEDDGKKLIVTLKKQYHFLLDVVKMPEVKRAFSEAVAEEFQAEEEGEERMPF